MGYLLPFVWSQTEKMLSLYLARLFYRQRITNIYIQNQGLEISYFSLYLILLESSAQWRTNSVRLPRKYIIGYPLFQSMLLSYCIFIWIATSLITWRSAKA